MSIFRTAVLALLVLGHGGAALAGDFDDQMKAFYQASILPWARSPQILDAVAAQNLRTADLTQDDIDRLDKQWVSEIGTGSAQLIDSVTRSPVSDMLRAQLMAMKGAVTEIIVMDARGLNVATSSVPSDYWQGDEAKYQETYGVGPEAMNFGEVEFDDSFLKYQGQISFTLVDPETGTSIGAMTVAVDAEEFL
ncbi:hypothetical protein [Rhodovulum visakhapatnamense]|uniref:Uncharacterized protein n=1 Tax=Rhodovulum visakhapatnamense TaxID=364297 RepID=A0A4R8FSS9_9RHOB|nr:hypothetical protein [Rhodovulum visakhapatnamense]TDX29699.1 hypothetical protein EV657_108119 [Rhodovulum visakhapatnamense]